MAIGVIPAFRGTRRAAVLFVRVGPSDCATVVTIARLSPMLKSNQR